MRRTPLKRIGKRAKQYEVARQSFLAARYLIGRPGWNENERLCECECINACGHLVSVTQVGTMYKTSGHVHHLKKRSTHPELRLDPLNLALLNQDCHRRMHP